jgi:hypothetical protein
MKAATGTVVVSRRLEKAISELRVIQRLLLSGEGMDDRILTDFRDAVNRVRNAAWSAKQYAALKANDQDPASVMSILATERIRATFQLVQALQSDLDNKEVKFQAGQLIQLQEALKKLSTQLDETVGRLK